MLAIEKKENDWTFGAKVESKDEIIKSLKEELKEVKQQLKRSIQELKKKEELIQETQEELFSKALNAVVEVAGKNTPQ